MTSSRGYSPSSKTTVQRRSLQMTDAFLRYEKENRVGFRWKNERPNNIQVITGMKYANHPREPVTGAIRYVCDRACVVFCWYRSNSDNSEIIHSWLERLRMKNVCRDVVSCLSYLSWARGGQGVSDGKVEIKGKVIKLKLKMTIFFSRKIISSTILPNHLFKPSLIF